MIFNSIIFWIFFALVYGLYRLFSHRAQNILLLVASYLFYGWWDWRFLILIAVTSFCSWGSGLWIQHVRHHSPRLKSFQHGDRAAWWISAANIAINLLILGFFKYYNFFVDNFVALFAQWGISLAPQTLHIILPVGISFYTFQALSYSIDVFRRKMEPTRDILAFFTFVAYFPQLVAGPIERASHLLPQIQHPRVITPEGMKTGAWLIFWGLFKK
ncbi:MAG: MBOAT family protein, partial [Verrucomicrobiota bacterium]|nr:MBOAT family protein [Verrucomicrobiota bacterium]